MILRLLLLTSLATAVHSVEQDSVPATEAAFAVGFNLGSLQSDMLSTLMDLQLSINGAKDFQLPPAVTAMKKSALAHNLAAIGHSINSDEFKSYTPGALATVLMQIQSPNMREAFKQLQQQRHLFLPTQGKEYDWPAINKALTIYAEFGNPFLIPAAKEDPEK